MILLLVVAWLSFLITMWIIPRLIKGLVHRKMVVRDYYKERGTEIPSKGGLVLLFTCVFTITIIPLIVYATRNTFHYANLDFFNTPYFVEINVYITLVLLAFGIFGMFDDYLDIGRLIKTSFPLLFAIPLIMAIDPHYLSIPLYGQLDLHDTIFWIITYRAIFRFMIIPVYILVTSNLTNMHSGFNGLSSGTSLLVLWTLIFKAFADGSSGDIVAIGAFGGGLLALWLYNRYPAKIFEGNTGSLMIGASIGICIVVKGYLLAGFVMLIPHTINFLMWVYWRLRFKMEPENPKYKPIKFGWMRNDGTLWVPNPLTLKWVLPYYFRLNEPQAVYAMYALTAVFCLIGLFIPY